jgi:predicted RNase H-like HicB family nuclease
MKIRAIVHKATEGGYWAEVPSLPGCVTQGETMREIRANLKEAIELWLEASQEIGKTRKQGQILELAV